MCSGKYAEADPYIQLALEAGADDDWYTKMTWSSAKAILLANKGETEEAIRLALAAVELVKNTDWLTSHARALVYLGET